MNLNKNKFKQLDERLKRIKFNRKTLVFFVFLIISAFLWLLNSLNKEYTDVISYPILFKNIPEGFSDSEVPQKIKITVKGHGYDILSNKFDHSKVPIIIDFNKFSPGKNNEDHYFILGINIKDLAKEHLQTELNVIKIQPDTIHLRITKQTEKYIPVIADIDYKIERQYVLSSKPRLKPDSVLINGPEYILIDIDTVYTKHTELSVINSDINRFIAIDIPQNTKIKPDRVKLYMDIEKYTEIKSTLELKVKDLPDTVSIELLPDQVNITYDIPVSKYRHIDSSSFLVAADFNSKSEGKLFPVLLKKPDYVDNVRISPKEINYILSKKPQND